MSAALETGSKNFRANLKQARALFLDAKKRGFTLPEHRCENCPGKSCVQPLMLGMINESFGGETELWGTGAPGSIIADWDYRTGKVVRLVGMFPAPGGGVITEYYTQRLASLIA